MIGAGAEPPACRGAGAEAGAEPPAYRGAGAEPPAYKLKTPLRGLLEPVGRGFWREGERVALARGVLSCRRPIYARFRVARPGRRSRLGLGRGGRERLPQRR